MPAPTFSFRAAVRERAWLERLFGPDSLMPDTRDLGDIRGMFHWFFFRGPKPSFERWTYWKKFDFLAVFWGMFANDGSGLLLWFPEFFGQFVMGVLAIISAILISWPVLAYLAAKLFV